MLVSSIGQQALCWVHYLESDLILGIPPPTPMDWGFGSAWTPDKFRASVEGRRMGEWRCAAALLRPRTDLVTIRDYLVHAGPATTSRHIVTNLKMKSDALQTLWKHAGIEPDPAKPWKPKPDLLAFLQSL
jgi:hypothetical protein